MVICLERGADLHMAQLMPLPLTETLIPAHPGSPRQRVVKQVVCACACVTQYSVADRQTETGTQNIPYTRRETSGSNKCCYHPPCGPAVSVFSCFCKFVSENVSGSDAIQFGVCMCDCSCFGVSVFSYFHVLISCVRRVKVQKSGQNSQ